MKPLIINTPSLQSLVQKYTSIFITLLFWLVWILLWTPLFSFLCLFHGIDVVYLKLLEFENYDGVIEDLVFCFYSVVIMGGGLSVWALYNCMRFKNEDRRATVSPVTNSDLSAFFHINRLTLITRQETQCLSVSFDKDGNIIRSKELIRVINI